VTGISETTRAKLLKVLAMLGSPHDGERAAAALLASRMVVEAGGWDAVISSPTASQAPSSARPFSFTEAMKAHQAAWRAQPRPDSPTDFRAWLKASTDPDFRLIGENWRLLNAAERSAILGTNLNRPLSKAMARRFAVLAHLIRVRTGKQAA
jgi:hypothetical protein